MSEWVANSGTLHSLHEWHRLGIWVSLFFLYLNGLLLKKKWSPPFLASYKFKGKSDSPKALRWKNLSLQIWGLILLKKIQVKMKDWRVFFNTGKNITIQSFSKFTRILTYILDCFTAVFWFFQMSGHLAKQVSTMHIKSFIECGILKYF